MILSGVGLSGLDLVPQLPWGAGGAYGLAPFGYWPLTLIALTLIPAFFLACETRARTAWLGWAFATGYFAHALSWIIEPFQVDAERHAWMAPFALVFMAGGLALFWAVAFWAARRVEAPAARQAVSLALTLSLAEFGRGYLLTGFPWAGLRRSGSTHRLRNFCLWLVPMGWLR